MTYLTQVTLDFAAAARLNLRDTYDWHQAVWQAFPGMDGANRDFLTRLDRRQDGFRLFIVSGREPVRPSWCANGSWGTKPIWLSGRERWYGAKTKGRSGLPCVSPSFWDACCF